MIIDQFHGLTGYGAGLLIWNRDHLEFESRWSGGSLALKMPGEPLLLV